MSAPKLTTPLVNGRRKALVAAVGAHGPEFAAGAEENLPGRPEAAVVALDSARSAAPDPARVPALAEVERQLAGGDGGAIYFW